jgi:hypothetical protein
MWKLSTELTLTKSAVRDNCRVNMISALYYIDIDDDDDETE